MWILGTLFKRHERGDAGHDGRARPRRMHRILVAILSVCFGLMALEGGSYLVLRFVLHVPMERGGGKPIPHIWMPSDGSLPFRMKTDYEERHRTDEFDTHIRLNNVGMREDVEYHGEHVDVAFVGDSFTFGWGVNVGERYSDVLRTFFPAQRILSYGYLSGLAPPHYYLFLKTHPKYVPNTLVLGLLPVNDLDIDMQDTRVTFDVQGEPVAASLILRYVTDRGALGVGRNPASVHPFLRPFVTSYTGKLLWLVQRQYASARTYRTAPEAPSDQRGATLTALQLDALSYITRLRDLMSTHGGRLVVFLMPIQRELTTLPPFWSSVTTWLRDQRIAFIDPLPLFAARARSGEELYYARDGHWNVAGHRLAAELLAAYLRGEQ